MTHCTDDALVKERKHSVTIVMCTRSAHKGTHSSNDAVSKGAKSLSDYCNRYGFKSLSP